MTNLATDYLGLRLRTPIVASAGPLTGDRHAVRELAELVLEEAGVAVVPGEAFGTPGYFRLSYALGDADLEKGVSRMGALLAEAQ